MVTIHASEYNPNLICFDDNYSTGYGFNPYDDFNSIINNFNKEGVGLGYNIKYNSLGCDIINYNNVNDLKKRNNNPVKLILNNQQKINNKNNNVDNKNNDVDREKIHSTYYREKLLNFFGLQTKVKNNFFKSILAEELIKHSPILFPLNEKTKEANLYTTDNSLNYNKKHPHIFLTRMARYFYLLENNSSSYFKTIKMDDQYKLIYNKCKKNLPCNSLSNVNDLKKRNNKNNNVDNKNNDVDREKIHSTYYREKLLNFFGLKRKVKNNFFRRELAEELIKHSPILFPLNEETKEANLYTTGNRLNYNEKDPHEFLTRIAKYFYFLENNYSSSYFRATKTNDRYKLIYNKCKKNLPCNSLSNVNDLKKRNNKNNNVDNKNNDIDREKIYYTSYKEELLNFFGLKKKKSFRKKLSERLIERSSILFPLNEETKKVNLYTTDNSLNYNEKDSHEFLTRIAKYSYFYLKRKSFDDCNRKLTRDKLYEFIYKHCADVLETSKRKRENKVTINKKQKTE